MIVVACGSVSDGNFHFADWVDRHSRPPVSVIHKPEETFSVERTQQTRFSPRRTQRAQSWEIVPVSVADFASFAVKFLASSYLLCVDRLALHSAEGVEHAF